MKILLINNPYKQHTAETARELAGKLEALNIGVQMEEENISGEQDLMIIMGGDGTILRAARQYAYRNLPVLSVNMGTVGFLSKIELDELDSYLDHLISGKYTLDQRMMLDIVIYKQNNTAESFCCLNELVIRSTAPRMVSFDLAIDDQRSGTYRGDGLIIASPTGSTAYSLSAGGPVCDPEINAFIITPIAPHSICKRPMVLSADRLLQLTPLDCQDAIICIDGQIRRDCKDMKAIKITRAEFKLKLIDLKREGFFSIIGDRLRRVEEI